MSYDQLITDQELDAIEALCNAATPGPLTVKVHSEDYGMGYGEMTYFVDGFGSDGMLKIGMGNNSETCFKYYSVAQFIAHAREDVLRLVAEVRRLRVELQNAEPVKYGRWKQIGLWDVACGNCGKPGDGNWLRCPRCEAKMDGFDESMECKAALGGAKMDAEKEGPDRVADV